MQPPTNPFSTPEPSPEDQQAISQQREVYARCCNLLASPDFTWFLKEGIDKPLGKAREDALSVDHPAGECEVARHVHAALQKVRQWVEQRRETASICIKSVDNGG